MLKKLLFFMLILPISVLAQNTFSGKVIDASSNQAMPGVSVTISGSTSGTFTDSDGVFTLKNVKNGEAVSFSFLGYKTETITFTNQQDLTVSLQQVGQGIEEVVVVGYGKVKKKDATGSVTQISSKEFNKGATPTVENLLNGRVAGVQITTGGGPAGGSAIRIRGGASLNASNDPLIVIDGLPLATDTPAGSRSFLATLDPNTVESITVLKDASSTAIYGARGSNGVILITTKKGGKNLKVEYNFQYGSGKTFNKIDVLNSDQFIKAIQDYSATPGNADLTPQLGYKGVNYNTDWQNEIYRKTDYVNNNLSLYGNLFKAIPTRLSMGNTYSEGLRLTDKFDRTTASVALNPSLLKDHLKFSVNANYSNERNRFAPGVEGAALRFDPTKPVFDATSPLGGFYEHLDASGTSLLQGSRNPVAQLLQTNNNSIVDRVFGNVQMDYKLHFLPDLRAIVNVGYDHSEGAGSNIINKNAATAGGNGLLLADKYGTNEYYNSKINNKLLDAYFVYSKKLGDLDLEATAGYSYQKFESVRYGSGNKYAINPSAQPDYNTATDLVLIGFFGRTNLTYKDKYLLTLAYRRDGSSRFPKEEQFANFPAVSVAWKINKDLFENSKTISDLKLRAGWGVTGQQDFGNNDFSYAKYISGNQFSQYTFGTTPTLVGLPLAYNPNIKWEETTTYNTGIDYGFFNGRISGTIDAFYKISKDLITNAAFADGSNFSNAGFQNIGSFTTKGIELNLNAQIIKKQNFSWDVNFNATKFERRIKELAFNRNQETGGVAGGTGINVQVQSEGWTPNSFYVYKQLYNENGLPIEGAFADLNGDNIINSKDKYIYKNPDPDLLLGFQSTLNYKNLDFSFNLRASIGNRLYNNVNSGNAYVNLLKDNQTLANIPESNLETGFKVSGGNQILSDYFVENASFLRMDNVTLGYTFPKWLEGKASVRLSAGIQNPFIITKYSGLDPEVFGGIDNTIYPRQRQFLFGANIKF